MGARRPDAHSLQDCVNKFWASVEKTESCWNWIRATNKQTGYGVVRWLGGKARSAHTVSWELAFGDRAGMCVCHKCDNRRCVRPDHLFLGTLNDNNQDMMAKDRYARGASLRVGKRVKLSAEVVRAMRVEYAGGGFSYRTIAMKYGVTGSTAEHAINRRSWADVE